MFPHPAARILLWCCAAVALQRLSAPGVLGVAVLAAVALERIGLAEFLALLRRARWLLLALAVVYALLPGAESASAAPDPIVSGFAGALLQAARLVLTLALLALLLATTPIEALVSGVHRLSQPLHRFGVDPDRLAVRIGLTIHYCATVRPGREWRDWGGELRGHAPEPLPVARRSVPLAPADIALVVAGAVISAALAF